MDKTQAAALGAVLYVGSVFELDRPGLAGARHTNALQPPAPQSEQREEQLHIEGGDLAVPMFWKTSDTLALSMDIAQVTVARRDAHGTFLGWLIQQNF